MGTHLTLTHSNRHPGESRDPAPAIVELRKEHGDNWAPACAGVTSKFAIVDART